MNDPIRVLLVDDEQSFLTQMKRRLVARGFEVQEASSGPAAFSLTQECGGGYDVAVIDQVMGPPNGIETMRHIKSFYPDIEVIILTGWGDMEPGEEAMRAGAYRYLSKPIGNLDELALNVRIAAQYGQEHQRRLALETLVEAGRRIGLAESEEELYERLFQEAQDLLPDLGAFLLTRYEEPSHLVSFMYGNVRGERLVEPPRQGANGLSEFVLRTKEPLLLPCGGSAFRQEHGLQPPISQVGHSESSIVVPMFLEGQVWGTINVHTYEAGIRYTREHLEVLQAYAYQVAVAIRNVRQIRAAERLQGAVAALAAQRGKEAILRTIVTEAHNLTGYAYTSLIVHNQDGTLDKAQWTMPPDYDDPFDPPRQQDGLSRRVVESGRSLVIRDAQTDVRVKPSMRAVGVRAILAMPMVHSNRVQGVLFTHTLEPWYFTRYELDLWNAFASQAATVLHNATEQEASEIWKTLDGEIATCSDQRDIYRLFAKRAIEALHADFAVYYPFDTTVLLGESRFVFENSVYVGELLTPWQVPQGGQGGGVYSALERTPDGLFVVNDLGAERGRLRSNLADREKVKAFVGLRLEVVPDDGTEPLTLGNLFLNFRRRTSLEPADLVGLQLAGNRVAVAIERLYLLDLLQKQGRQLNERLRAVIDVFRAFRERQSGHWILERIAQGAKESLHLDSCMLVEYDAEEAEFTERGAAGLTGPEPDYRLPQASTSWFLNGDGPIVVSNAQEDPRLREAHLIQQEGIQQLVVCPLRVEGTPLGLLFAGYRSQQEIEADELEAISLFADLAGMVIREIRLQDALGHTQKRLQRRLFLDWVTMIDNTWRHSLVGKASAIRNDVASMWRLLRRSSPEALSIAGIPQTLGDIDDLAREIAKAPPQVPQSWELEEELIPLAPLLVEVAQREGRKSTLRLGERVKIAVDVKALADAQVRGYRRWIIHALEALLQNAYKAMPHGGTVTLCGQRKGAWAEVNVRDTGVGVPEVVRNKLFKELIPKERDSKGMGIGGLLVATIIEDHEGSVRLETSGPEGTAVLIRLPLVKEEKQ